MAAASHDRSYARRMGIPQTVAKEFNRADTGGTLLGANSGTRKERRRSHKRKEPV